MEIYLEASFNGQLISGTFITVVQAIERLKRENPSLRLCKVQSVSIEVKAFDYEFIFGCASDFALFCKNKINRAI